MGVTLYNRPRAEAVSLTTGTFSGNVSITGNSELRFYDDGNNYVGFEAPALTANKIWVLPNADGTNEQVLRTDGSGTLSWATAAAGAGTAELDDTDASNILTLDWSENASADYVLDFKVNSANRTVNLYESFTLGDGNSGTLTFTGASKTLSVEDTSVVNQDLTTDATVTFGNYSATNKLTACTTNAGALDFSAASKTLTVEDTAVVSQDYSSDAGPTFATPTVTGLQATGAALLLQDDAAQNVAVFNSAASGETPAFTIAGFKAGDAKRTLSIAVGSVANNTATITGCSEYTFSGNLSATTYGSAGTVTDAELTYLAGVTSAIQAQFSGKAASSHAMSTHSDEDTYNISTSGSCTIGSLIGPAAALTINNAVIQDVNLWAGIASGNPSINIYGYNTAGTDLESAELTMDDTNDEFLIQVPNSVNNEGVTVGLQETNQRFRVRQNSDEIQVFHDGTDAGIYTSDGGIKFTTGEGAGVAQLKLSDGSSNYHIVQSQATGSDITLTCPNVTGTLMCNVAEDTTPQLGGILDCQAHSVTFTQQTATGDGTTTIDWSIGNKFYFTFGAQADTFTFTAPSVGAANLLLVLKQDATGSRTATWPNTVMWPAGTAPTLTTGANTVDIVTFYWDGTNYFGNSSLAFAVPA